MCLLVTVSAKVKQVKAEDASLIQNFGEGHLGNVSLECQAGHTCLQ
jgi:hypothetical protein